MTEPSFEIRIWNAKEPAGSSLDGANEGSGQTDCTVLSGLSHPVISPNPLIFQVVCL